LTVGSSLGLFALEKQGVFYSPGGSDVLSPWAMLINLKKVEVRRLIENENKKATHLLITIMQRNKNLIIDPSQPWIF
jgi:hypothetical protein